MEMEPLNPNFRQDIETFALSMPLVRFIGLSFTSIEPGSVEVDAFGSTRWTGPYQE